ncbi:hypothetical protein GCM10012275_64510 [Longimycelium tulufanense]|uniref:Uncharacterized protein n=1 Tax=Longimycelium tulufanense TaxID=907463 RepID=A0A8J3CJ94_9PSEU|nr:hypothetical protein [Longimycelium tulufanense]GGM84859.1 hypothetical protein GCM10012275_64510 [Longimycelium tulufanense]
MIYRDGTYLARAGETPETAAQHRGQALRLLDSAEYGDTTHRLIAAAVHAILALAPAEETQRAVDTRTAATLRRLANEWQGQEPVTADRVLIATELRLTANELDGDSDGCCAHQGP